MKRRTLLLVATGVLVLSGFGAWARMRGQNKAEYRTAGIDRGNIESTISATGSLNALVTVQVGSQVSGNIKELYADFNTRVEKGQVVARIDPEILQARVIQAQANLEAANAAVLNAESALQKSAAEMANAQAMLAVAKSGTAREKANSADAQQKFARRMELFKNGLISNEERDSAKAAFDAASAALDAARAQEQSAAENIRAAEAQRDVVRTQLTTAQAQVKQMGAALRQAQIDLEHTYIRAPVDGVVVSRKIDVGQTVAASLQAPTLFEIAQDLTKMQVHTNVDEADIGRVQVNQDAVFTVDAYPNERFRGKVFEIRKAPINVQNVVTYDVVVSVENPEQKLFPGMTANVRILIDRREGVLRVPNAALRFRPADAQPEATPARGTPGGRQARPGGQAMQTVWIVDENGKPKPVKVQLGISDGNHSEVAGGELREGDEVILSLASTGPRENRSQPPGGGRGGRLF